MLEFGNYKLRLTKGGEGRARCGELLPGGEEEWCATSTRSAAAVSNALLLPSDCCAAHREPHLVGRAAATAAGTAHCLPVCAVPRRYFSAPSCSPAWERAAVAQVPPPPPSGIFEDSPHVDGKAGPCSADLDQADHVLE